MIVCIGERACFYADADADDEREVEGAVRPFFTFQSVCQPARACMDSIGSDFDGYRLQARRLEKQIYTKLDELAKLNVGVLRQVQASISLGTGGRDELQEDAHALQKTIEELLAKLEDIISRMTDTLTSGPTPPSSQMEHAVDRFREVHRDYLLEFNRTRASLRSSLQRAELFAGNSSRQEGSNTETEMLLREQNQLHASINMIDELIGRAEATREHLSWQKGTFSGTASKLSELIQRFPLIQNTMTRIRRYQQRDRIILAALLAVFMLFTFWYTFG